MFFKGAGQAFSFSVAGSQGEGGGTTSGHHGRHGSMFSKELFEQPENRVLFENRGFEGIINIGRGGFEIAGLEMGREASGPAWSSLKIGREPGEIFISPGSGNAEAGMDQEKRGASEGRDFAEGFDLLASAEAQSWILLEEERDIRAERGGQFLEFGRGEGAIKQIVQAEQCGSGVTAAATEASGERNIFLEVNPNAGGQLSRGEKFFGGFENKISRIDREVGQVAGKVDAAGRMIKAEPVMEGHGEQQRLKLVKSIGTFPKDVQDEIDLTVRKPLEGHK